MGDLLEWTLVRLRHGARADTSVSRSLNIIACMRLQELETMPEKQKQIRLYITLTEDEERELREAYARDIFEGATRERRIASWAKNVLFKHI